MGGIFDIRAKGELVWSRKTAGRFSWHQGTQTAHPRPHRTGQGAWPLRRLISPVNQNPLPGNPRRTKRKTAGGAGQFSDPPVLTNPWSHAPNLTVQVRGPLQTRQSYSQLARKPAIISSWPLAPRRFLDRWPS